MVRGNLRHRQRVHFGRQPNEDAAGAAKAKRSSPQGGGGSKRARGTASASATGHRTARRNKVARIMVTYTKRFIRSIKLFNQSPAFYFLHLKNISLYKKTRDCNKFQATPWWITIFFVFEGASPASLILCEPEVVIFSDQNSIVTFNVSFFTNTICVMTVLHPRLHSKNATKILLNRFFVLARSNID